MRYKYINDKDPWFLAEHFPNIDFFFSQIWLFSFVNNLSNSCGKNYKKVLAVFQPKNYIHFYYGKKDSINFEKHLVNKILVNVNFGKNINKNIIFWSDKLNNFNNKISNLNLINFDNKSLWEIIEEQDNLHKHLYEWGWLSNATDMFHNTFTLELKNILNKKLKKSLFDENEIFNTLTTPEKKSVAAMQDESLAEIADLLKKNRNVFNASINKKLDLHFQKYFYLKYLWIGPKVYTRSYFKNIALKLAKSSKQSKNINSVISIAIKRKKLLYKKLNFSKNEIAIYKVYSDFMLTKIYRRYAQIRWAYEMSRVLSEIAKRLKITLDEVRYFTLDELKVALLNDKLNKKELKKRLDFFLYYVEKGKDFYTTNQKHFLVKQLNKKIIIKNNIKELKGQIGCLGKATGIVKIINSHTDMFKFKKGDILVSIATNPDLVPVMKKAAAIITEQGGVTSHAAIVSRELNVPCIIGTKIATQVLNNGDKVEVDAYNGVIKILSK